MAFRETGKAFSSDTGWKLCYEHKVVFMIAAVVPMYIYIKSTVDLQVKLQYPLKQW